MRRLIAVTAAAVATLLLQGCMIFNMHKASEDRHLSVDHIEGSSLLVSSRNGGIEVIADPNLDEVVIDVHLTCSGSSPTEARDRLAAAAIVVERDTSRALAIRAEFPGGGQNNDGARFVVRLPDAWGAELNTSNGRVIARGLAGPLVIDTSNGRVIIEDHDGDAQVRTSNGRVEVRGHDGALDARTSNGSVTVALLHDSAGPVRVRSSNGSIRAEVGVGFVGRVEFDTSNGRIRVNGNEHRIVRERISGTEGYAVLGPGDGPDSRLDTSNGNIELYVHE